MWATTKATRSACIHNSISLQTSSCIALKSWSCPQTPPTFWWEQQKNSSVNPVKFVKVVLPSKAKHLEPHPLKKCLLRGKIFTAIREVVYFVITNNLAFSLVFITSWEQVQEKSNFVSQTVSYRKACVCGVGRHKAINRQTTQVGF